MWQNPSESTCNLDQKIVPEPVTEGVVNGFKVVKIRQKHRSELSSARAGCHCLIEFRSNKTPIRQFRQRVKVRQLFDGMSLLFLLCDVSNNGYEAGLVSFKLYVLEEHLHWHICPVLIPVNGLKIES